MGQAVVGESEVVIYLGKRKLWIAEALFHGNDIRIGHCHKVKSPTGFVRGVVQSVGDAVLSLQALIQAIQSQDRKETSAWIAVGQSNQSWYCFESSQYYGNESKLIQSSEIRSVIQQTQTVATLPLDQKILQALPDSFRVDDVEGVKNPIGLEAKRLGVQLKLFTMPYPDYKNLSRALEASDFEIDGFVPQILALSEGVLTEEEKNAGVLLLDISGDVTQAALWKEGRLKDCEILPLGGDDITKQLAEQLHLDFEDAEKLKESYGSLVSQGNILDELIPVVERGGKTLKQITRREFHEIYEPIMGNWKSSLMSLSQAFLERAGVIHPHYVFTGGGASPEGLMELMAKDFGIMCRLGLVHKIEASQELLVDPSLTSALSVFRWLKAHRANSLELIRRESGFPGVIGKVRDFFTSYF